MRNQERLHGQAHASAEIQISRPSILIRLAGLLLLTSFLNIGSTSTMAGVFFTFDFTEAPHFDPTSVASLQAASSRVESLFSSYTATVNLKVTSSNENSGTLASAGSAYPPTGTVGFANRGIVGTKILSNGTSDPNGSEFDGEVDVNFYHDWDFGDTIAPNNYDFQSTMIHELIHAVGFSSSISENGQDPFGTEPGSPGVWAPFDEFVADADIRIIGPDAILDDDDWFGAYTDGAGTIPPADGLYFVGPNAMAANGDQPVPLYSPDIWEEGSSGSHLDDEFFTGEEALLMNAAANTGLGIRTLSPIEIGILQDIGFTAVPEPWQYPLTFIGFLMISVFRKRLRNATA